MPSPRRPVSIIKKSSYIVPPTASSLITAAAIKSPITVESADSKDSTGSSFKRSKPSNNSGSHSDEQLRQQQQSNLYQTIDAALSPPLQRAAPAKSKNSSPVYSDARYEDLYSQVDKSKIQEISGTGGPRQMSYNEAMQTSPTPETNPDNQVVFTYSPPALPRRELSSTSSQSSYDSNGRHASGGGDSGKVMEASVKKLAEYVLTTTAGGGEAKNVSEMRIDETDEDNNEDDDVASNEKENSRGKTTTGSNLESGIYLFIFYLYVQWWTFNGFLTI
jgi:hypothetical protein